ncbi:hypothetical protein ACFYYB_09015 [Streptomyces sp. NPDC002886]|uniref:hypothetical protein n=1 Tax=Streptomyces sp. NPDC002886 TaxID=3364667 RepID=UPI0036C53094
MPFLFPRAWHRPLVVLAGVMGLWAAGCAVGILVDDRILLGAPIWVKPFKFAASILAYALSLAWMISLLGQARPRLARPAWWAGTVVAVAGAVEMVLITAQAFRGRQSHFNYATPFDAQLYNVMAGSIVMLWLGALVIAVLLFRARIADRATTWSIRIAAALALIGAGLGFLMTRPTAEQLAAGDDDAPIVGGHAVGVPDGGPGLPLTGWSTTGGDLRVPHFVGMHAIQLLPLLVLLLAVLAARFPVLREERVRLRLVLVAGSAYGAVLALLTWQALRGQPLTSPDGPTLGAAALILVAAALGALLGIRRGGGREAAGPAGPGSVPRSSVRSAP